MHSRCGSMASARGPVKSGGLKGSTQHWLAVYPPAFEIPTFFVGADLNAERFRPGPSVSSKTDLLSSAGIAARARSAVVFCHPLSTRASSVAMGRADQDCDPFNIRGPHVAAGDFVNRGRDA